MPLIIDDAFHYADTPCCHIAAIAITPSLMLLPLMPDTPRQPLMPLSLMPPLFRCCRRQRWLPLPRRRRFASRCFR